MGTPDQPHRGGAMATVAQWWRWMPASAEATQEDARGGKRTVASESELSERKLIERCLRGDQTAWELLVSVHGRRVYSICLRFTGNPAQAEDITQEVFLRVFRSLASYRPEEGSFTVWITRLTRNLLIDHYRRARMERLSDSLEDHLPKLEEQAAMETRTDGMLVGREVSELLQKALQHLSPELRETLILRDLEHLEYKEIASALRIPEGTVKSRLNRARAELGRLLRSWNVSP